MPITNPTEYSRLLIKGFSTPGVVPTIPASDTIDNTWLPTDLKIRELAVNIADDKVWILTNNGLVLLGDSSFTGGTIGNLTASTITTNSISATTYYGLPKDIFVTGGTYSAGTATFSNTTGGTFTVSGFNTGATQIFSIGSNGLYSIKAVNDTTTDATGNYSYAEGADTIATGDTSHAEGYMTKAYGDYSHAEGYDTRASGARSHAEGNSTDARGAYSHSQGHRTAANGNASHAQGTDTIASGLGSHAEGGDTVASGNYSHAEGSNTRAIGNYSHSEGYSTQAVGSNSHAEGVNTVANGNTSHAEGADTIANGDYSHTEGSQTIANIDYSHAEGFGSIASGVASHAQGNYTIASGDTAHAEGAQTIAGGESAHAEGQNTTATGWISHAEGHYTTASGPKSHAEGDNTQAIGGGSHSQGYLTKAYGSYSHAGGQQTIASGATSFVHGYNSSANGQSTIVLGENLTGNTANTVYTNKLNIKSIGAGTSVVNLGWDAFGNIVSGTTGILFDTYVTGGTYTNGTATFKNNSGGTFTVTGFTNNKMVTTFLTVTDTIESDASGANTRIESINSANYGDAYVSVNSDNGVYIASSSAAAGMVTAVLYNGDVVRTYLNGTMYLDEQNKAVTSTASTLTLKSTDLGQLRMVDYEAIIFGASGTDTDSFYYKINTVLRISASGVVTEMPGANIIQKSLGSTSQSASYSFSTSLGSALIDLVVNKGTSTTNWQWEVKEKIINKNLI